VRGIAVNGIDLDLKTFLILFLSVLCFCIPVIYYLLMGRSFQNRFDPDSEPVMRDRSLQYAKRSDC